MTDFAERKILEGIARERFAALSLQTSDEFREELGLEAELFWKVVKASGAQSNFDYGIVMFDSQARKQVKEFLSTVVWVADIPADDLSLLMAFGNFTQREDFIERERWEKMQRALPEMRKRKHRLDEATAKFFDELDKLAAVYASEPVAFHRSLRDAINSRQLWQGDALYPVIGAAMRKFLSNKK